MKLYRHKKTNGVYRIRFHGRVQCAEPLRDMAPVVVYEAADGSHWVRPLDEFFDGRFEEMEVLTALSPDTEIARIKSDLRWVTERPAR